MLVRHLWYAQQMPNTCRTCGNPITSALHNGGTCKAFKTYASYKYQDDSRGYQTLDWQTAKQLLLLPCVYCGFTPAGGLDRKDNFKGHTADNVLPCCPFCNITLGVLSYEAKLVLAPALAELRRRGLVTGADGPRIKHAQKLRRGSQPELTNRLSAAQSEIFWSNVSRGADNECWLWHGPLDGNRAAIQFEDLTTLSQKPYIFMAVRVAYATTKGLIDGSDTVHRQCNNIACMNPNHLYIDKKRTSSDAAEQLRLVRDRYANGESIYSIATSLDATQMSVHNVVYAVALPAPAR
jgi:hypothetical protein